MLRVIDSYVDVDANGHTPLYKVTVMCGAKGCGASITKDEKGVAEAHAFSGGKCACGKADKRIYSGYLSLQASMLIGDGNIDLVASVLPHDILGYLYDIVRFKPDALINRAQGDLSNPNEELLYAGIIQSMSDAYQNQNVTSTIADVAEAGHTVLTVKDGIKATADIVLAALKKDMPKSVDIIDNALNIFDLSLQTVAETSKNWDNAMLIADMAGQYASNLEYLENCIAKSEGEVRRAYERVRNELELEYKTKLGKAVSFVRENDDTLYDFHNGAVNELFKVLDIDDVIGKAVRDTAKSAATNAALKAGKSSAEAAASGVAAAQRVNVLLAVHGGVTFAADKIFHGEDIYELASEIHKEQENLASLAAVLEKTIAAYEKNLSIENARQLKKEAVVFGKYSLDVLDKCEKYARLLTNAELKEDLIARVNEGREDINDLIARVEDAYVQLENAA